MHELGHFFGLAHTPDDHDATMWACAAEGEVHKRELAADDLEGICAMYGSRVTAGCGCGAPGARGGVGWPSGAGLVVVALAWRRARHRARHRAR